MKSTNPVVTGQIAVGLVVAGLGVLFLLDNLGIISFGAALSFWPSVLILVGLIKLLDSRSPGGRVAGVLLLAFGGMLMLGRVGLFDFSWRVLWPMILIAVGGVLVHQALFRRTPLKDLKRSDSEDMVDATAILGGFERRLSTQRFQGGELSSIMGGCSIDLRDCSIEGEAVINVFAFMGGIVLKIPPDWTVVLNGTPIMGGFEEKTARPPNSAKRLVVTGYAIMGGVEIRN